MTQHDNDRAHEGAMARALRSAAETSARNPETADFVGLSVLAPTVSAAIRKAAEADRSALYEVPAGEARRAVVRTMLERGGLSGDHVDEVIRMAEELGVLPEAVLQVIQPEPLDAEAEELALSLGTDLGDPEAEAVCDVCGRSVEDPSPAGAVVCDRCRLRLPDALLDATTGDAGVFAIRLETGELFTFASAGIYGEWVRFYPVQTEAGYRPPKGQEPGRPALHFPDGIDVRIDAIIWIGEQPS